MNREEILAFKERSRRWAELNGLQGPDSVAAPKHPYTKVAALLQEFVSLNKALPELPWTLEGGGGGPEDSIADGASRRIAYDMDYDTAEGLVRLRNELPQIISALDALLVHHFRVWQQYLTMGGKP